MSEDTPMADRDPYAVLAREHRLIERALDVLSRICDEARRTKTLNAPDATLVIQFLRDFADRTHHLKEERVLFPAIESRADFPGCGLVSEHQLGRERVTRMASVVEGASDGDAESLQVFVRQARSLIGLLRDHIAKEDDCLANVVHREFSGEDLVRLTGDFEEIEHREFGERTFEPNAAIVEALEAKHPL
ncbi:MAG TPA: hemerythrin domain-containing protein [Vicinamibacterales bacterium]